MFTGGDYVAVDVQNAPPDGKITTLAVVVNTPPDAVGQRIFLVQPIIDGVWFLIFTGKG